MATEPEEPVPDEAIREAIRDAHRIIASFHDRLGKRLDAEDTAVLQAHFLLEEQLDELLEELALQPKRLNLTLQFDAKVKVLRTFAPLGDDDHWEMVEAINALRNKIAHLHGREQKHVAFRKLRERWKDVVDEGDWDDYNIVLGSTVNALAFLSAVRDAIKRMRSVGAGG